jgi:hypothetical protein
MTDISDEELESMSTKDLEFLAHRIHKTLIKKIYAVKVVPNPFPEVLN